MKIQKELEKNQTILLIVPSVEYSNVLIRNLKELTKQNVCYVTLNKTVDSLRETFKKNHVNTDNIVFIDAISKTIKKVPDQEDKVYYVSSPGALTELSIAINRFLKHQFQYLVFDSLTNLLIYQKKAPVAQFVSAIVNKIKISNTKGVFYTISVTEQEELIKETCMFVDKVFDLEKKT